MAEKRILGSKKRRKCYSDWSAVSCKNNTSGNLVIINLQGLQVQGGVEMNSTDRSRLQVLKKRKAAAGRRPSVVEENQRPPKEREVHNPDLHYHQVSPELGDLFKDGVELPSLEQHLAMARARCSEAFSCITAVEQRVVSRQQQMTQLHAKIFEVQQEARVHKREAAYLQQLVGDLELANGQLQRELQEAKSRVQLQIKEAQIEAVVSFKQSQEFQDLVDSSCLKGYDGALSDVRARMAALFPAIDTGFLDSLLDGDEPVTSPSAAAAERPTTSEHTSPSQHCRHSSNRRSECSDWAAVTADNTTSGKVTISNVQGLQLQGGVNLNSVDGRNDIRGCSNWNAVLLTNKTTGDVVVNNTQGLQIQGGVEMKNEKTCKEGLVENEVHEQMFDVEGTSTTK